MRTFTISFLILLGTCITGRAQQFEIDKISTKQPLQVRGGISANAMYMNQGGNPLNYVITGHLNFTLFDHFNLPLMMNYSDRKVALSQGYRFNQISIHPSYKWATAHLGTTAMSFSPYTLNGHQFTGAGVELSPGNWRIQAMHGRLLKGQHEDTLNTGPTFTRTGFGYKLEYVASKFSVGTTLFKARDHESTLSQEHRVFNGQVIHPGENTVAGLHFSTTLFTRLQVSGEYANSLITKDRSPEYEQVRFRTPASVFQKSNGTTTSNQAFNARVNYHHRATHTLVGVGYERVDPDYSTFGGYYFVNDLVNYTLNFNQTIGKNKWVIGGNAGLQRDDIRKTKVNTQSRFVANLNAQANLNDRLGMGLVFSNFRSYRFINDTYSRIERVPDQIIDTLDYSLVSRTLVYNLHQKLKNTASELVTLSLNSSYIASRNVHGKDSRAQTDIINSGLVLAWELPGNHLGYQVSVNHFYNGIPDNPISGIGPAAGFRKAIKEELQFSVNASFLSVSHHYQRRRYFATNSQASLRWNLNKSNRVTLNAGVVRNQNTTFLNGNLAYNYSFN